MSSYAARPSRRPERPVCPDPRCGRVMVAVGDAVWECPHMHGRRRVVERSVPRHPDIPRILPGEPLHRVDPPAPRPTLTVELPASPVKPRYQTKPGWRDGKVHCSDCGREMRPNGVRAANHPGTVNYGARGRCQACYRRVLLTGADG